MPSVIIRLHCKRCSYRWWPRRAKKPPKCPRCRNPLDKPGKKVKHRTKAAA